MQRIKLDVFQTLFTKNLTGNEIDFILALSHMQDERGCVCGLHYKEMMAETGMSAQAFYDCKKSLQEKRVIEVRPGKQDYDICLLGNDFTTYTKQDYSDKQVKYVKTNSKLFADRNWKRLKPAQKLLAMDLYHISRASKGRTYRIGRQNFLEKYADRRNPDGSIRRGKLGISERTLQKYLKMLKLYFYIGIKEGMYYITLRSVFAEEAVASENNQTYDRLVQVACRRNRIGACDKKEARQIRDVLVYYRKLLLEKNIYILDIFTRMIETINAQRIRPAKWKRYLKKSLFHKILREEYLFA